jgi:predicted S18 family serine protease
MHRRSRGLAVLIGILLCIGANESRATIAEPLIQRDRSIPILGVTLSDRGPVGIVARIHLHFEERSDRSGLMVLFMTGGGKLSPKAQTSVQQALYRAGRAAKLSTDSWTVRLSVPEDMRVYGDSLSAMIALTVVALAKNETIPDDRVITGGITPDGQISQVGGLSLKIAAAKAAHMRRVIVPDTIDTAEGDWQTPFLMHVSPVSSVQQAYWALTGHALD